MSIRWNGRLEKLTSCLTLTAYHFRRGWHRHRKLHRRFSYTVLRSVQLLKCHSRKAYSIFRFEFKVSQHFIVSPFRAILFVLKINWGTPSSPSSKTTKLCCPPRNCIFVHKWEVRHLVFWGKVVKHLLCFHTLTKLV